MSRPHVRPDLNPSLAQRRQPVMPEHVECTRVKLERLVGLGFLNETKLGLLQQPRAHALTVPADERHY